MFGSSIFESLIEFCVHPARGLTEEHLRHLMIKLQNALATAGGEAVQSGTTWRGTQDGAGQQEHDAGFIKRALSLSTAQDFSKWLSGRSWWSKLLLANFREGDSRQQLRDGTSDGFTGLLRPGPQTRG